MAGAATRGGWRGARSDAGAQVIGRRGRRYGRGATRYGGDLAETETEVDG